MRRVLERIVAVFSSFKLAVGLFLALLVVVLVGTLEQQYMSLYEVQQKYFASLFFTYRVFDAVTLPFPGGALLLGVLLLNLSIGGLMRIRWKWPQAGVIVAHLGIVFLLVGGFVEYRWSQKGFLKLYEGEKGARFQSYDDWDLTIVRDGAEPRQWFVPSELVASASGASIVRVTAADLPFDVALSGYSRHTVVKPASSPGGGVDGVELVAAASPIDDKVPNVPGLALTISPKTQATSVRGYIRAPIAVPERDPMNGRPRVAPPAYSLTTTLAGESWHMALVRRSWPIPFETRLDSFVHREHPGTSMPSEFSSYVNVVDGAVARDVHITMNEPLRLRSMTLYQSGWNEDERGVYSVFAVVHNPSDQVPKLACWIIFVGMLLHFVMKLIRHLRAEKSRRERLRPADRPRVESSRSEPVGSTS